jgi:hypothetical protein
VRTAGDRACGGGGCRVQALHQRGRGS